MPETSVQRRDEALPDKSGVSMSSISLSLEAETCPEDVRFVRYSRQLCNIVGSVKSFPVQSDEHLLTVLRYIEWKAVGAGLVARAEHWRWSSLWARMHGEDAIKAILAPWPVERPVDWTDRVNAPLSAKEFGRVRVSIERGRPFGEDEWVKRGGDGKPSAAIFPRLQQ